MNNFFFNEDAAIEQNSELTEILDQFPDTMEFEVDMKMGLREFERQQAIEAAQR
jgi:hypothetical protein